MGAMTLTADLFDQVERALKIGPVPIMHREREQLDAGWDALCLLRDRLGRLEDGLKLICSGEYADPAEDFAADILAAVEANPEKADEFLGYGSSFRIGG